ncbi:MAG: excinuclease ABC subunit UvrA [Verrucomicrobia bacterium]|nr:excinuclease ABC subunit UvrA [Verrucomicrobiota bacterium]
MSKRSDASVIRLRGVRHNNLKNFDLDLPAGRLIVVTGPSGSGKSSLAFDTLYAEGQRRYIETFSPYARQFFDRMDKPRVDSIEGIPPAIAIEQRNTVKTTRSTVGTITEVCDYMKFVWSHLAQLYCRQCGRSVRKDSPELVWETLLACASHKSTPSLPHEPTPLPLPGGKLETGATKEAPLVGGVEGGSVASPCEALIAFELDLSEKISLVDSLALVAKQGYHRLLWRRPEASDPVPDIVRVEEAASRLESGALKRLTVLQDRLVLAASNRSRFIEGCEQAYHFGRGKLVVFPLSGGAPQRFSNRVHCAQCDLEYREPAPALFSFNHPLGACPTCRGFGRTITIDYDLAIPDRSLSLVRGAVKPWQSGMSAECQEDLMKFCKLRKVPTDVPFRDLPQKWQDWVLNGDPDYGKGAEHEWPRAWYGIKGYFRWLESRSYKMHVRVLLSRYRAYRTCADCRGQRFQSEALNFKLADHSGHLITLADFYQLAVSSALHVVETLAARRRNPKSSDPLFVSLNEVRARLKYLDEVGLGYLTLDRATRTLSGGETERVSLTTCLGSGLVNTLFVLDEPSVGLHARDTARLVEILKRLRDAGNTVVVVEHEASVMRAADQIVDLGPGHGETGGQVVFQGTFDSIRKTSGSLTGAYLSGHRKIEIPPRRKVLPPQKKLLLSRATLHNLKNLAVKIPLERQVCITGVSGSGKTTLIRGVLLPALQAKLRSQESVISRQRSVIREQRAASQGENNAAEGEESEDGLSSASGFQISAAQLLGAEHLGRVVLVDQSPIGKTPRSTPAVYTGAFDHVRELFARTEIARRRGLKASAFSFNSREGQCERCRGAGFEKIEMQFLSDVFIRCPECAGRRYRGHILQVRLNPAPPERGALLEAQTSSSPLGRGEGVGSGKAAKISKSRIGTMNLQESPSPVLRTPSPPVGERERVRGIGSWKRESLLSWSIADFLEATVEDGVQFLTAFQDSAAARQAASKLKLLEEVGLGYLRLGQPINTLSGGECQRLKLVSHLAEFTEANTLENKPTLFLFDEPTTGLHFEDIAVLLRVFHRLVESGHSVVIIEHNLDVIKCADWIIDLGPDAGEEGGRIVVEGTPEQVAACATSHTGHALREMLEKK